MVDKDLLVSLVREEERYGTYNLRLALLCRMLPDEDISRMRVAMYETPRKGHGRIERDSEIHGVSGLDTHRLHGLLIIQPELSAMLAFDEADTAHLQPSTHSMTMILSLSG